MIALRGIEFTYPDALFSLKVDRLDVASDSRVAIVGPSGSGKSTLIGIVAGILVPQCGTVEIDGEGIQNKSDACRRRFRLRNIGMVFQSFSLLPYLTVHDNIRLAALADTALRRGDIRQRCDNLLESVGLGGYGNRFPNRLSHGEQQRVAVCRALVTEPRLIVADEPTANLDSANARGVMQVMIDAIGARHATLLMSTHNRDLLDSFQSVVDVDTLRGKATG